MLRVAVVGAGIAGLTCARALQQNGWDAHIYEASDGVGGRVRTDMVDGFRLDRGFQVLLQAYPSAQQELDLPALNLCGWLPGAILLNEGHQYVLADPRRLPQLALASAACPLFTMSDKVKVLQMTRRLMASEDLTIFQMPDEPMGDYLMRWGYSRSFLDNFIRPFFGGIFLETELKTSVRMFAFVWKMLAQRGTSVPALGMGAIAGQIAAQLSPGTLHLNSEISELMRNGAPARLRVNGEVVEADVVVLATPFDVTARLTEVEVPMNWRASVAVYYSLPEPLYKHRLIALFTAPGRLVNNAAMITNVAPEYAPSGRHLLCCSISGTSALDDRSLDEAVRRETAEAFGINNTEGWHMLRIYRIAHAQFEQEQGIWGQISRYANLAQGVVVAGEAAASSSIEGALASGRRAAAVVMGTAK